MFVRINVCVSDRNFAEIFYAAYKIDLLLKCLVNVQINLPKQY